MRKGIPEKGSKVLRKGRVSIPVAFYFITTSVYQRKRILNQPVCFQILMDAIRFMEHRGDFTVFFVIAMPDHVHLVFQLGEGRELPSVMLSFKGYTGRKIKEVLRMKEKVWQNSYYDHCIRKEENLVKVLQYAWYNPVRARLVEHPKAYPFWWSRLELEE